MPAQWVTYFSHFILRFVEISLCGALSALHCSTVRRVRGVLCMYTSICEAGVRYVVMSFFFSFLSLCFIVGVEKFGVRALEAVVFYRETIAHVPWPSLRCCFPFSFFA